MQIRTISKTLKNKYLNLFFYFFKKKGGKNKEFAKGRLSWVAIVTLLPKVGSESWSNFKRALREDPPC
jgi:hypothetical protein